MDVPKTDQPLLRVWSQLSTYWVPTLFVLSSLLLYAASKAGPEDVLTQFVPQILRNEYASNAFLSIGLSILAARIFSDLSEGQILARIESVTKGAKDELIRDTTKAVLGSSYPRAYFDEVLNTCFAPGFVRENFRANYTLSRVEGHHDVVCLTIEMYGQLRNFGETSRRYSHKHVLPNSFRHLGLITSFSEISVGSQRLSEAEIRKQIDEQQHLPEITLRAAEVDILRGQAIPVIARASVFKNISDNEAFRSFYPCESMTVVISGFKSCGVEVGISSIHRTHFDPVPHNAASDTREWKLSEFTLPQNGWVVFWNPARDVTSTKTE